MESTVRVLIVDDHEVFVDALAVCLGDFEGLEVVGGATSSEEALAALATAECDVLVLDLDLAGDDGLVVAAAALDRNPNVGVVVATGLDDDDRMIEAVRMGVRGWLSKTSTAEALAQVIRGVAAGETHIPAEMLAGALVSLTQGSRPTFDYVQDIDELTSRERQVLACLVDGLSRTEIGELLHVSPNTVRTHVQSILHKLKVHSALAAVAIARRAGVPGDLDGDRRPNGVLPFRRAGGSTRPELHYLR
jgi:DNA-binding NarL/FixJ family response regulator